MNSGPRVIVVGGGLIGSSVALELARRGSDLLLIDRPEQGTASAAAAGILAPSIEEGGTFGDLGRVARDRFPAYVRELRGLTGLDVALNREGVLHVATSAGAAAEMKARVDGSIRWLDPDEVAALEPALSRTHGALLARDDGAVDNVMLLAALRRALELQPGVRISDARVTSVDASAGAVVAGGKRHEADHVVLAAGAWVSTIEGARYAGAVRPIRGQIVSYDGPVLRHVVYAPDVYLVPRATGCTLAGSTMEDVGFDAAVTDEARTAIDAAAQRLCPALGTPAASWAGLRPLTKDLMPLIGRDPEAPRLIYACGHSRNGVLLTPITAEMIAALIFEARLTFSLSAFDPARFGATFRAK